MSEIGEEPSVTEPKEETNIKKEIDYKIWKLLVILVNIEGPKKTYTHFK